ncbi:uncharacterized protein LOC130447702 [Diorhabda sublineata]|uniref:uncharacterized protein LOC130447702 n=1 Tax=Diorhabda sublineata TaxID=1163346 RepID=UPI0024E0E2C4|nr:uncharacterized protein LOC130447702 [Diorhabda sublineata]
MVNGTLLVVGFFVVATRLLIGAAPSPVPFFWFGDYGYDSSEEEEEVKKIYVYINSSQPEIEQVIQKLPNGNTGSTLPVFNIPVMVQFIPGTGGMPPVTNAAVSSDNDMPTAPMPSS